MNPFSTITFPCARCGQQTTGTQNAGGITTAICVNCEYEEQEEIYEFEDEVPTGYECMSCGMLNSDVRSGGELFTCGYCGGSTIETY